MLVARVVRLNPEPVYEVHFHPAFIDELSTHPAADELLDEIEHDLSIPERDLRKDAITKVRSAHGVDLYRYKPSPSSLPDGALVIPMSLLAKGKNGLTQARWQVLQQIRSHGRYNRIQDLADALGRGKHRVSKDVDALASLGLVHKEKKGRETAIQPDPRQIMVA